MDFEGSLHIYELTSVISFLRSYASLSTSCGSSLQLVESSTFVDCSTVTFQMYI